VECRKKQLVFSGWKNAFENRTDLTGLRDTAAYLLGFDKRSQVKENSDIPKALAEFISGKPRDNAFDDFALWDEMLVKAYGERKFMKYVTDDEQIYSKKEQ
jgi:hypothetical protein